MTRSWLTVCIYAVGLVVPWQFDLKITKRPANNLWLS
jgi:hypothetical protein